MVSFVRCLFLHTSTHTKVKNLAGDAAGNQFDTAYLRRGVDPAMLNWYFI